MHFTGKKIICNICVYTVHLCIYSTFVYIQYIHFCFGCLFVSLLANIDKYLKSAMFFLNKKGINFTLKKCLK